MLHRNFDVQTCYLSVLSDRRHNWHECLHSRYIVHISSIDKKCAAVAIEKWLTHWLIGWPTTTFGQIIDFGLTLTLEVGQQLTEVSAYAVLICRAWQIQLPLHIMSISMNMHNKMAVFCLPYECLRFSKTVIYCYRSCSVLCFLSINLETNTTKRIHTMLFLSDWRSMILNCARKKNLFYSVLPFMVGRCIDTVKRKKF